MNLQQKELFGKKITVISGGGILLFLYFLLIKGMDLWMHIQDITEMYFVRAGYIGCFLVGVFLYHYYPLTSSQKKDFKVSLLISTIGVYSYRMIFFSDPTDYIRFSGGILYFIIRFLFSYIPFRLTPEKYKKW